MCQLAEGSALLPTAKVLTVSVRGEGRGFTAGADWNVSFIGMMDFVVSWGRIRAMTVCLKGQLGGAARIPPRGPAHITAGSNGVHLLE